MAFSNLLSQITKSLDNFQEILAYEKQNFESKFSYFKEEITNLEGKVQQYQQQEKRDMENWKSEETESEYESGSEDLQEELEDTKRKLEQEEIKNKELNHDVEDLNALIGLYVKEAKKRDELEKKWQENVTGKLKTRLRDMENEILLKLGEINNLENIVTELRAELNRRDEKILNKDEEIKRIQEKLKKI